MIVASPGLRHPCRWPGLVTADWLKREELLSGHAAPGHRTQAVASTLLADRAVRDDQIGAFPTAHPILERPQSLRHDNQAVQVEGQGEVLEVNRDDRGWGLGQHGPELAEIRRRVEAEPR